jgi:hypothetical protein
VFLCAADFAMQIYRMLLCNTITERLQIADFCEEIVMKRSQVAMAPMLRSKPPARRADVLSGD